MKLGTYSFAFAFCALAAFAGKKPVLIEPCDCTAVGTGEERWTVKTDPQPAPVNTATVPQITPADMCAWQAPSQPVGETRTADEQKFYALVCKIVAMKLEDDGDLHIEVENTGGASGRVVVELPCGPTWCEMRKHVIEWTKTNSVVKRKTAQPVVSPHNRASGKRCEMDLGRRLSTGTCEST